MPGMAAALAREALAAAAAWFALPASAAVLSVGSGDAVLGNRPTSLIVNGSFEHSGWVANGADTGATSWVLAGTGTTLNGGLVSVPAAWTTSGDTLNYGVWGNDSTANPSGTGLRGSAPLPDGSLGIYMGNQSVLASLPPTFLPSGEITFPGTPLYTHIPPVGYNAPFRIEQTVSGLDPSATYRLDFWLSGEDAAAGGFVGAGLLELDITGEPPIYLAVPYSPADSQLGDSQRYYVEFQPSGSAVTLGFLNHGHLIPGQNGIHTEAVLDDVILNRLAGEEFVPEPGTLALGGGVTALAFLGHRWRATSLRDRRTSRVSAS